MKYKAFTLLEMLLVLMIAAAILVMATRYFTISMRNMHVTQAISDIQSITKASYEWLQTQKQENFSDTPNGVAIDMQQLIEFKLIQPNDSKHPLSYYDPWGGEVEIGPGKNNASRIYILMKNVPKMACLNLVRKTQSLMDQNSLHPACDKDRNDYYGEF